MKSAKPLDRHDLDNLSTRSARAWVRVRATVEENERLREVNAELLAALELLSFNILRQLDDACDVDDARSAAESAITRARSAPLEQEVKP